MKLLIVECNPDEIWKPRLKQGIPTQVSSFVRTLDKLLTKYSYEVAYPSESYYHFPNKKQLASFDGAILTGSALLATEPSPAVSRQLDLVQHLFDSSMSIYGSCWGTQIACLAAGGKVGYCPNGREFGIAESITLNEAGRKSPFFTGKSNSFSSYCTHQQEVTQLPVGAELLASNEHSKVQAVAFKHKKADSGACSTTQEFDASDVTHILNLLEDDLIAEGRFDLKTRSAYTNKLEQLSQTEPQSFGFEARTLELKNWLKSLR